MKHVCVTISREYGSGGRYIGQKLAEQLGIRLLDREIIKLTAKQSGYDEAVVEEATQKKTNSLLYNLYMTSQQLPINDQVFLIQSDIIRKAAASEPCIIVGRCGDYVLQDAPNCLHVFIHAPLAARAERVRRYYDVDAANVEAYIRRQDKQRSAYYNYYTQNKWGDAHNYHLCVDSSLGIEQAAALIAAAARAKAAQ